jgi:hypothetical protein
MNMALMNKGFMNKALMNKVYRIALAVPLLLLGGGFGSQAKAQGFEVGAQVAAHNVPELGETPFGYGFRFTDDAYPPFVSLDSEINFFPTSSTGNLGETQGFFGVKAGLKVGRWGVFAKLRPGFDSFGGGSFEQRLTSRTHFALDIGGVVEYYVLPRVALRLDLGDVMTDFGGATLVTGPGRAGVPLGSQHNFESTFGAMLRF